MDHARSDMVSLLPFSRYAATVIKAVFFDIDDTLIDHSAAMGAAIAALYESLPVVRSFDEFHRSWKAAHGRHYPRFLRGEVSYVEASRARIREAIDATITDEACDSIFGRYLADYERGWNLFPDVLPCLDALRHMCLGVISNGRIDEQTRKLTKLGVRDRFSYLYVSEDFGTAKPDPRIFRHACDKANVAPNEALYVGDQYEVDARAARSAGLHSVWLNRGGATTFDSDMLSIGSLAALPALATLERSP